MKALTKFVNNIVFMVVALWLFTEHCNDQLTRSNERMFVELRVNTCNLITVYILSTKASFWSSLFSISEPDNKVDFAG